MNIDKITKQFLRKHNKHNFNKEQIEQIKLGFQDGLTEEQILLYANSEFNAKQMEQIRYGFLNDLSIDQISIYAKPEFDHNQMEQIRFSFQTGLSIEQVKLFAKPEYNSVQMYAYYYGLLNNLHMDKILFCLNKSDFLNLWQISEVINGFKQGLTIEQVSIYANPLLSGYQMRQIRQDLAEGILSKEQIMIYAKFEYDVEQMQEIKLCIRSGLTDEQLKLCLNSELKPKQIEQIRLGFEKGLDIEQVKIYANPEFSSYQMEIIRNALVQKKLSIEQVKLCANPDFSVEQMKQIIEGFCEGLSIEQIQIYAKTDVDAKLMRQIKTGFKKGLTIEQINFILNFYTVIDAKQFEQLRLCIQQDNLSQQQIKELFTHPYLYTCSWDHIYLVRKCYQLTNDYNFTLNISKLEKYVIDILVKLLEQGVSKETVDIYRKNFNYTQLYEILEGYLNKLSEDQISIYAKPDFSHEQMEQIRLGFKDGLTLEQIMVYADKKFYNKQMKEIRLGFKNGLSMEQVMIYAKKEFSYMEMEEIRYGLMELPTEIVVQYAKPGYSCVYMRLARKILSKIKETGAEVNVNHITSYYETIKEKDDDIVINMDKYIEDFWVKFYAKKVQNVFGNLNISDSNKSNISTKAFKI